MFDNNQGDRNAGEARWADPDYIADKYFFSEGDVWIGRNPHNWDSAIGYKDDRHIMVCAGAGSGKGRSFIVNNLALYTGSTITYDPKGELPFMMAARRGQGDEYCDGMGQEVFVLDPLNRSGVDDRYKAFCDPISMLDPKDPELSTWCLRLARSLVKEKESGQSQDWADKGIAFIALVIEHVVTDRDIRDNDRSLHHVLQLILEGDVATSEKMNLAFAEQARDINATRPEGTNPIVPVTMTPYATLLAKMRHNTDANAYLSMEARKLERESETVPKYFTSVTSEAAEGLRWLRSDSMQRAIKGWGDESRRFDPRRLKTDPVGISVFIVMPVDDLDTYEPWLQCLFVGIFAAMREERTKPKIPTLMILDEFSSLGYQDYIASSLDNIRGAGLKIAFIVQNFGKLKKLYGDEMESFFTNTGLELYFGKIGQTAIEYLKKELGDTYVVKLARNKNQSQTGSQSTAKAIAFGETSQTGGNESESESSGESIAKGESFNWNKSVNHSDSRNWGQTSGNSMGKNYGPHTFFAGLEHSDTYGTNLSRNSGGSHTRGGSKSRGGGTSTTKTTNTGQSKSRGRSWSSGTSRTETETDTQTEGYSIGGGVAETFHKKPLLDGHEINSYLRSFPADECDHPAYPGMMLVRIHGEDPFFVRRSHYDQDSYFERCFSADPLHGFLPLDQQPMLGHEYTPAHIGVVRLPALGMFPRLAEATNFARQDHNAQADLRREFYQTCWNSLGQAGVDYEIEVRPHQKVKAGEELMWMGDDKGKQVEMLAPVDGRVLAVGTHEQIWAGGPILVMRANKAAKRQRWEEFENHVFEPLIKPINADLEIQYQEKQRLLAEQERLRLAQEQADAERRAAEERERQRIRAEIAAQEEAEWLRKRHRNFFIGKIFAYFACLTVSLPIVGKLLELTEGALRSVLPRDAVSALIIVTVFAVSLVLFNFAKNILNDIRDNP